MRRGILGSKGDPWHWAHLLVGHEAAKQFGLNAVDLLPAGQPVDKPASEVTPRELRWQFTELSAQADPLFNACRIEIDRNGPSYMADTMREYRRIYGDDVELFLIIGADRAPTIGSWHEPDAILAMCTILVAPRGDEKIDPEWVKSVLPAGARFGIIGVDWASDFLPETLRGTDTVRNLASSTVRKLRAGGKSVRGLLPDAELDLMDRHGTYLTSRWHKALAWSRWFISRLFR